MTELAPLAPAGATDVLETPAVVAATPETTETAPNTEAAPETPEQPRGPDGKFIASHQGDYRILLPSENKRQVDAYMSQADRKLRRAHKLSRNTPSVESYKPHANNDVRIAMKLGNARNRVGIKPKRQESAAA